MEWQTREVGRHPEPLAAELFDQEAQTRFMAGVYRWMFLALALTGGVAFYTVTNQALLELVARNLFPLVLVELGLAFALSLFAQRLSGMVAAVLFLAYAAFSGLTFSVLTLVYQLGSIAEAFALTGGIFLIMSIYGTVTKRDLTSWGTFLMMGLVGVIIAGVINIFLRSDMLGFVKSCAAVVVFTGLTAYDTQKLRGLYYQAGGTAVSTVSVLGAFTLYLDFVNLFLALLRLFGRRR